MPVKTARWMAIAALMILLTLASFAYADEKVAFNADSRVYLFPNLESVYVEVGQGLQGLFHGGVPPCFVQVVVCKQYA